LGALEKRCSAFIISSSSYQRLAQNEPGFASRIAQTGQESMTMGTSQPRRVHHLPFITQTTEQPISSPPTTTPKPAAAELARGISHGENDALMKLDGKRLEKQTRRSRSGHP